MFVLEANKTKMLRLVRAMGYNPPHNARFVKAYRSRHWWLEWSDNSGFYQATLSTAAYRAFFGMRFSDWGESPEQWTAMTLSLNDLRKFDLLKELPHPQKGAAPVQNNTLEAIEEPGWEPEW